MPTSAAQGSWRGPPTRGRDDGAHPPDDCAHQGAWWPKGREPKEPGFQEFLAQLLTGPDPELRRAASFLDPKGSAKELPQDWPIEVSRLLTLVIAEYARRQHAMNTDRIIRDPERTIGLASPRTHLIPARLFRLLGTICAHHGRSFEDTMRLPLQESGLGTDDAHPRFVACMLRLGDLLDLDGDDLPEARRFDRGVRDPWCAGAIGRARVGSASMPMALPGPFLDLRTPDGCTWHQFSLCRWAS